MQKRHKPILPVPSVRPPEERGTGPPTGSVKRRRSTIIVACNSCRARKSACDGNRPACIACVTRGTTCIYISASPRETPGMAMRREIETLKKDHGKLAELLDILRTVPEAQAFDVLRLLRLTTADHADLLPSSGGGGGGSSSEALPRQVLVRLPTHGSIEFRLMVRHAVAYPTLAPLDAAAVGITSLLAVGLANSAATELISQDVPAPPAAAPSSQAPLPTYAPNPNPNSTSPPTYCDPRLALINIGSWSRIEITDELAASLVSLYLETDHPILGFFDADLFLQDLVDRRARYCSALLVSSLLSWACHAYSTSEPEAASMGEAFFDEADAIWQHEHTSDSLPTVAAAQFLSLCSIYNGDDGGLPYLHLGTQMAQRMGLFGLPHFDASQTGQVKEPDHWFRARSHTAWGVFNWITMRSFMFQEEEPAARYPPKGEPPGGGVHLRSDELGMDSLAASVAMPAYMGQTFPAMCEFWVLTSKWTSVYYMPGGQPVLGRVPFAFANGIFQKLLAWSDNLHILLARGDQSSHHSVILHIWFHASVLQLFRPFTQDGALSPIKSVSAVDSDCARATFAASLNQLKHLTIVFRYTCSCASYAIFWHVALLCVANAVLQDTQDPQWRPYFMLCVNSYSDLFGAFRVAEGIIRGLLSIAVAQGSMGGAEARALAQSVQARGIHHTDIGRISTSFVVDLELAMTDRDAAQLKILSENFDDLTLFDEFLAADPIEVGKSLQLPDPGGGGRSRIE